MYSLSNDNAVWDVTYQKEVSKFILEKERMGEMVEKRGRDIERRGRENTETCPPCHICVVKRIPSRP